MGRSALLGHPRSEDSKMYCVRRFCFLLFFKNVDWVHLVVSVGHICWGVYLTHSPPHFLCISLCHCLYPLSLTIGLSLSHTLHRVNKSPPPSLLHSQPLHAQRIHWLPRNVETRTSFLTWESCLSHTLPSLRNMESGCLDSKGVWVWGQQGCPICLTI